MRDSEPTAQEGAFFDELIQHHPRIIEAQPDLLMRTDLGRPRASAAGSSISSVYSSQGSSMCSTAAAVIFMVHLGPVPK
jgi:hypothetical protein